MTSELRVDRIVPTTGVPTGGGGGIVQIQVARKHDEIADSSSGSYMASGLICTLTPRFSNSKFHIHMCGGRVKARAGTGVEVAMYVSINGGSYAKCYSGNRGVQFYYSSNSAEIQVPVSFVDLFTPSTPVTSTISFQPYWKSFNNGNNTFLEYDSASYAEVVMTVMEVSA